MKIEKIIADCGYQIVNNDVNQEFVGLAYADQASKEQIAIAKSRREILSTESSAVLTEPMLLKTKKTLIYSSDSLETALVKVAKCFIAAGEYDDYSMIPEYSYNGKYYFVKGACSIGEDTVIGENCILGRNVTIGCRCVIEPNVKVGDGTVIGDDVHIGSYAVVGAGSFYQYTEEGILKSFCGIGKVVVEDGVSIGNHTTVQRGVLCNTIIGAHSQLGNLIDIGHDVRIGSGCKIVSQTGIAGNVVVGNRVTVFGQVGIANGVQVGDDCQILGKSLVTKNLQAGQVVSGMYAREHLEELETLSKIRNL